MDSSGVGYLDWPAKSPHLNVIELVWRELKRRLKAGNYRSNLMGNLEKYLVETWKKIELSWIQMLLDGPDAIIHIHFTAIKMHFTSSMATSCHKKYTDLVQY
eukprot:NODE_117_length_18329_cov_0.420954.p12 type:complete len:102 gc:universal NODE_117_length_18329_cov_0.420954:7859-7554(-)